LVLGTAPGPRGFWRQQFSERGGKHIDETILRVYLDMVGFGSGVLSVTMTVTMTKEAREVFEVRRPNLRDQPTAQLLAAWLNFASGAVGWYEKRDGMTVGHRMVQAEVILSDANASHQELEQAKDLAEAINARDEGDPAYQDGDEEPPPDRDRTQGWLPHGPALFCWPPHPAGARGRFFDRGAGSDAGPAAKRVAPGGGPA
jgi:hypothetical protein